MTQQQMRPVRLTQTPEESDRRDTPPPAASLVRMQAASQRSITHVYTLWHDRDCAFGQEPVEKIIVRWLEREVTYRFIKVAEIEARDPDEVWALSQHLETDWTHGPAVCWLNEFVKVRSSAIGDIISLGEPPEEHFWVITRKGFFPPVEHQEER